MIAIIRGKLEQKSLTKIVVDVNGIGFELFIPMSTYDKLPEKSNTITLNTCLHLRQDSVQLYGFVTLPEKSLFLMLINSVSGIGPKLALNILSSMPVNSFCTAIINNDIKTLSGINGIGKRSAERLAVELRDKISEIFPGAGLANLPTGLSPVSSKGIEDAVSGLITLGFKPDSSRKTVSKLAGKMPESEITAQSLIRNALIILNK